MNTTELLAISSAIVPYRPATVFEGRRTTYADLHARVNRLANALADLGLTAGDRVAMLQVNSPEHVEAYFAAAKLDAVYVPLNFRSRAGELRQVVDDARPRVLIVGRQYVDVARELMGGVESLECCVALEAPVSGWSFYDEMIASASDEERFPQADGGDPTVIMFTAGTTGPPKGVMLGHDSFSSYVLSNVAPADPEVDERNILTVPMYHVAGLQALMAGVYGGRTLVIQRQFEPKEWMSLVESERVDRAMVVPTMLKMLMDHQDFRKHDLSSLRVITYGAAPMPLELIRRAIEAFPGAQFVNAFGQTETASTITMLAPQDHVLEGSPDAVERKLRRLSSIGRPLEDVQVRIVDEDGADVVQGEVGEIVARGERLMSGYWGRGEATAETIRGGWLHTGDLAYSDEDGYIFLAGRARDFIKRGGEMISPEEVEGVLHSHPAIDEAAIIGVPDVQWGERVRAVVVLRDGCDASEAEIIDYCRERLASFKKPESVVFAPALPRNTLGKVLKLQLREEYSHPIDG